MVPIWIKKPRGVGGDEITSKVMQAIEINMGTLLAAMGLNWRHITSLKGTNLYRLSL